MQLGFDLVVGVLTSMVVILIVGSKAEDVLDPCDMTNGKVVMYCQCNENDPYNATVVQCFVNSDTRKKGELRPEWTALATLTETVYLEFVMRSRFMKEFPPPILFEKMKKLKVFYVKTSEIELIPPYAFQSSGSVDEVSLKDNMIRQLSLNAFANMENLTKINLESNNILSIERNTFVNLPSLQQLSLGANVIEVIHDQAFKYLEVLEDLELQKNNLTYLTPEVFVGLKNLKRLDLMKNTIQFLGNNVFMHMTKLEDLDLTENKIISVSPNAFHGLRKLRRLNLRGNKIVEFHPGTFAQLQMIYFLDVRENELETFSKDLISDIYSNMLNKSMQLVMKDNRFKCDCRILWMPKLWNETNSQMVQYYLNQTMCDVPHKFGLALDETDLDLRVNEARTFENVTLISGPIEETTTSTTGSRIPVTTFTGEGLKCGIDPRKSQRHKTGQRRVKESNAGSSGTQSEAQGVKEPEVVEIPGKSAPSSAEPINDNLGSSSGPSSSASYIKLPIRLFSITTILPLLLYIFY